MDILTLDSGLMPSDDFESLSICESSSPGCFTLRQLLFGEEIRRTLSPAGRLVRPAVMIRCLDGIMIEYEGSRFRTRYHGVRDFLIDMKLPDTNLGPDVLRLQPAEKIERARRNDELLEVRRKLELCNAQKAKLESKRAALAARLRTLEEDAS